MSDLLKEKEKLDGMNHSKNNIPSKKLLKQSQVVDKLIVEVMRLQLSKLKGGK